MQQQHSQLLPSENKSHSSGQPASAKTMTPMGSANHYIKMPG